MRNTIQRQVILEELRKSRSHPSAKDLYEKVKEKIPTISFGTVYRTLNHLKERGEIIELFAGGRASRWDGYASPHSHFICKNCNNIIDIQQDVSKLVINSIKNKDVLDGVTIEEISLELMGLCEKCSEKGGEKE